jgi:hypothetical protein
MAMPSRKMARLGGIKLKLRGNKAEHKIAAQIKKINDFFLKMRAKIKSQEIPTTDEAEITRPMAAEFPTWASI